MDERTNGAHRPAREVHRSKSYCIAEHVTHVLNTRNIPIFDALLVNQLACLEHTFHVGNVAGVPVVIGFIVGE